MTEKTEGSEKPFYENIVSQHKRTAKPPKVGKEGSENAGHPGYSGRPSAPTDSYPRSRTERPGSSTRFQRPDGSAPRSDTRTPRGDTRAPRGDTRAPRNSGENRGPSPRNGSYAPRGPAQSRYPRPEVRHASDEERTFAQNEAAREGESGFTRPVSHSDAVREAERNFARNESGFVSGGSAPRGDSRAPRGNGVAPRGDNRGPQGHSRAPRSDSYAPRGDSYAPRGDSRAPRSDSYAPRSDSYAPRSDSYAPRSDSRAPRGNGVAPRGDNRGPQGHSRAPRSDSYAPRSDSYAPRGDSRAPRSDSYAPRSDSYAPRSDSYAPRGDNRAPRSEGRPQHGDSRGQRSDSHSPRGDSRPSRDDGSRPRAGTSAPRKPFQAPVSFAPVFGELPADVRKLLDSFPEIVDAVFPLDSKKMLSLPADIRELSHDLTDERADRRVGYMNDPAVLSAYIRYYMWWNLVRLSRLLVSLPIDLKDGDAAVDLGSGPLTLPIALWMTRPELRAKKITWYCVDISQGALAAGEELFLSLAARTGDEPWQITRVKGECGVSLRRRVALVTSANMFNELFWENPLPLEQQAKHYAEELSSYAQSDSSILVIEPGVPRAGRFISLLRDSLIRLEYKPVSPCPHDGVCPFPGLRHGKWCHFVFDTSDAPAKLHKLSDEAGLAKDRAALSFIYSRRTGAVIEEEAGTGAAETSTPIAETQAPSEILSRISGLFPDLKVRVTSDPIRLPEYHTGRYGCSERGMVMLTGTYQAADYLQTCHSGSLVGVPMPDRKHPEIDGKTDAIIIRLK